jgi:hypothetical protein
VGIYKNMLGFRTLLGAAGSGVSRYDPTLNQPFNNGCIFWLGMDGSVYINNINNDVLLNVGVSNNAPTYDYPENDKIAVFTNTNHYGSFIHTGVFLDGSVDFSSTFCVKNPSIESDYSAEVVLSNTNKNRGFGFLGVNYEKDTTTIEVGSVNYGNVVFTAAEMGGMSGWLKVAISYNSSNYLMTVVINSIMKSFYSGYYESLHEVGLFDTTWDTGSYGMSLIGSLADVRFYNRQLTTNEIYLIMKN